MIKAVLLDLDGTLVSSLPELTNAVNAVMTYCNRAPLGPEDVQQMIGKGLPVLAQRVLAKAQISPECCTQEKAFEILLETLSESNGKGTVFLPGALESIKAMRAAGLSTVLVTNKLRALTIPFLKDREIETLFDAVITGDDAPKAKPAPDMLLMAARELGLSIEQTVMVGDSLNDALAARAAGCDVYLVGTGYNEDMPVKDWAAQEGFPWYFDTMSLLSEAIIERAQHG